MKMRLSILSSLLGAAMALAASEQALASVVEYTDLASFNAATTGNVTTGFSSIAPSSGNVSLGSSTTVGSATFTDSNFFAFAPSGSVYYGNAPFLSDQSNPIALTVSLSPSVSAISFDFGSYNSTGEPVKITVDGQTFTVSLPNSVGTEVFAGFTSSDPITSVTFGTTASVLDVVDYTTASASVAGAVPEPSTWAMLILGFAGIGIMVYRRKTKTALLAA